MEKTEQRRHPRLACRAPVQYRDLRQPQASYAGTLTDDVSVGGLRFHTAEWLPLQHRLLVQLALPGIPAPIRTVAQVIWTRKQPHSDRYDVGARFVEMITEDLGAVADYVERGARRLS